MFGISFAEFFIIFLALFLIVGPQKMAQAAYEIGKWLGQFKRQLLRLQNTHLSDFDTNPLYQAQNEVKQSFEELRAIPTQFDHHITSESNYDSNQSAKS